MPAFAVSSRIASRYPGSGRMQPVLHMTASVSTAAIDGPSRSIASLSAATSFHGRMIRFSASERAMPGPCGTATGR